MTDKGLLQFTGAGMQSDEDIVAENRRRYEVRDTGVHNPRQIKCFDRDTNKIVWGTHKSVSSNSKEKIFVPNEV